jgi:hypothetical protein
MNFVLSARGDCAIFLLDEDVFRFERLSKQVDFSPFAVVFFEVWLDFVYVPEQEELWMSNQGIPSTVTNPIIVDFSASFFTPDYRFSLPTSIKQ